MTISEGLKALSKLGAPFGLSAAQGINEGSVSSLVGEQGIALTDLAPSGRIFVHGEYWEADAAEPVEKGAKVVVDRVEGMRLRVRRTQG